MSDSPEVVRLSVNLATDTMAVLRSLASRHAVSLTEATRRAIGIWQFLQAEVDKGNRIAVVETHDGKDTVREVVLL